MTHATLSASKVLEAVAKAKNGKPHPQFQGHYLERLRALLALASAVQSEPLGNGKMEISADDFVIIAPYWEPPIGA
jgi:hypothetical protein